jgi:hypothetical protein
MDGPRFAFLAAGVGTASSAFEARDPDRLNVLAQKLIELSPQLLGAHGGDLIQRLYRRA